MGKLGANQFGKITLMDAKQDFENKGYTPLFNEYKNASSKLLAMTKEGYQFYTTIQRIRAGKKPGIFRKSNPFTIKNIELWLRLNNADVELLSQQYCGSNKKMQLSCPIHGVFSKTWDNLKQGQYCPGCGIEQRNEEKRLPLKAVRKEFSSRGYKPLFNEYTNSTQKLSATNIEGYKIYISLSELKSGNVPSLFSVYNPYTIQNIKLWLKLKKSPYEIISEKFISADQESLKWKCPKHGQFSLTWHKLSTRGCPLCGIETRHGDGGYNLTRARRNKEEWEKIKSAVYVIECWSSSERFYKIGVTRNGVRHRFSGENMPYNYKVAKIINTNLYESILLENKLHEMHKQYSYIPKEIFSGYTECFSKLDKNYIKKLASY